jgi:L-iditol 2-dehydrogenase
MTQLAARLFRPRDIRMTEEPEPTAAAGEVLIDVTGVGLCGSDLHWFEAAAIGDAVLGDRPLVLGHEVEGVIAGGPRKGQRVAVDPADPDDSCATCRAGRPELCPTMRFLGHGSVDGGLRETIAWPRRRVHPIPDGVAVGTGALLETFGVALHAIDVGEAGGFALAGSRVAVVGCGPVGLLVIRAARAAGPASILAIEPLEHRRVAAIESGADAAEAPEEIHDAVDGIDLVFECAGEDTGVELANRLARPGGRVVIVGIPTDDRTSFTASIVRRKALTLAWSRRMVAGDLDRAIELVAAGTISLDGLVTGRYPLAEAPAAFAALEARSGLKIVIEPNRP